MRFFEPFELPVEPSIPERVVNIEDFGAVPGGIIKNTDAISRAIESVAEKGGGRVVIPKGVWLTGPIHLKSNTELHLEKGCEVRFSTDKADYLPPVFTLYEGMRCYTYSAQLYAENCHDIAVTGEGTFNGQGFVWWYLAAMYRSGVEDMHEAGQTHRPVETRVYDKPEDGVRPGLLHFINCKNVLIEGCTFSFSPFWTIHPTWCENIIIRNVKVFNPYDHAPNTDGCNFEGCRRGLLDNIEVDTGDDAVCLKSGRDEDGREVNRPCRDIVLRHIRVNRCHGGITIGSEMSGGVENIYVEDCRFEQNFIGIWIKTAPERGGYVRNIEYHDVRIRHLWREGICFTMGYYVDDYKPECVGHVPAIENILIDGFDCEKCSTGISINGLPGHPIRGAHIENARIFATENVKTANVENLCMNNVTFK